MNELLFFSHIIVAFSFILIALRIGKIALITLLTVQILLANLFVTKQMICFGLSVTCTEVYTIGAFFSANLLQTYFGKKCAKKSVSIAFFLLFFMTLMSQFQLYYLPAPHDHMHDAFSSVLGYSPRIVITSLVVTFLCQKLNIELFGWLRSKLPHTPFWIPFISASLITQLIDTVSFSFMALYGIVHSMKDIIMMSYLIKVATIFCMAPFTSLAKKLVKYEPVQV
ncbi:queuosine precursor transporter [Candidatus Neptunochlamydia vexilliferae]|uniref:queuosine precursor transporter n=1 Tax=Candidatus Neptunichlamydia vexilliferae TaxID=1651774 RepID=UPI0018913558|nr:queuosine precursor transporter [Candidatus Neptunochlamydia vexilliferae]